MLFSPPLFCQGHHRPLCVAGTRGGGGNFSDPLTLHARAAAAAHITSPLSSAVSRRSCSGSYTHTLWHVCVCLCFYLYKSAVASLSLSAHLVQASKSLFSCCFEDNDRDRFLLTPGSKTPGCLTHTLCVYYVLRTERTGQRERGHLRLSGGKEDGENVRLGLCLCACCVHLLLVITATQFVLRGEIASFAADRCHDKNFALKYAAVTWS